MATHGKRSPAARRQHLLAWGLYVSMGVERNLKTLSFAFETNDRDQRELAQAQAAMVRLQTYLRDQLGRIRRPISATERRMWIVAKKEAAE